MARILKEKFNFILQIDNNCVLLPTFSYYRLWHRTYSKGLGVALITPFNTDGSVDYQLLKRLVEFQIDNGADFLLTCHNWWSPRLTQEEKDKITELVKDVQQGNLHQDIEILWR